MERLRGVALSDLNGIRAFVDKKQGGVRGGSGGDGGLASASAFTPEQTLINALNTWTLSVVAAPFFHADVHAGG